MNDLLSLVVEEGASDLHIQVGQSPTMRLHGEMIPVEGPKLTGEDTEALVMAITSEERMQEVKTTGGCDFGFSFMDLARFRVSVLKARGKYGIVLRQIPTDLFSLEVIGFPDMVKDLLKRPRGLILVTGPTG